MEVQCEKCKTRFKIADDKLPEGKVVTLKCPKCESKIPVGTGEATQADAGASGLQSIIDEMASDTYDAALKPFEFLEEGVETALICEQDEAVSDKIRSALESMDYNITEAPSTRDALKYMRFHTFDLVVLDEAFDGGDPDSNYVLNYLGQIPMNTRRHAFIVLVGSNFRTGDNMIAFHESANLVLHHDNLDDFERILKQSLADNQEFYRVLNESLKKVGKA
ncbi:MAG: zinc-ribbon domain-containing protein [Deltaproteobacteria bacterium]|nr:zinc-ribbon domain-containing protein [Deltaproteobacteria bacterium]